MARTKDLKGKRKLFVAEYLKDHNATQAYIRAGYKATPDQARRLAPFLMANHGVLAAIQAGEEKLVKKIEASAERTLLEMSRIGYSDIRRLFDEAGNLKAPKDWDDDIAAAVKGVEIEEIWHGRGENREVIGQIKTVRLWNKDFHIDKLAKRFKLYEDDESRGNLYIILQQVLQMTPQQLEEEARRVVIGHAHEPEPIATSRVPIEGGDPPTNGTAGNGVCH